MAPGRKALGSVKASELVPLVAMAPLNWTIPETSRTWGWAVPYEVFSQPFRSVSEVKPAT